MRIRKLFCSGDEALGIIDILTTLRNYNTSVSALWFRVGEGKIQAMEAVFDASTYKEMFVEQFRN